jgi:molybdopterin converting factor small subunit
MSVTFHIPGPLRSFANGRSEVEVAGTPATLSEALQALWAACPGIRDRVVTEQGLIRQHINIFVGREDVRYTGGLATPVAPGAEITIVPSVSGGHSDVVVRASRPLSRAEPVLSAAKEYPRHCGRDARTTVESK